MVSGLNISKCNYKGIHVRGDKERDFEVLGLPDPNPREVHVPARQRKRLQCGSDGFQALLRNPV